MWAHLRRNIGSLARRIDHRVGRMPGRYRVLVDVRTPMNLSVLRPVWRELARDERVAVRFAAEQVEPVRGALAREGLADALLSRERASWTRFDLAITADLWNPTPLRRCRRTLMFFHGVAGKYDLDQPGRLAAAGLHQYDRVAFINRDRLERYLTSGAVRREQAALVGFPKLDALLRGGWSPQAVRSSLGLDPDRDTILYAPTFSVASSLHLAGEPIIETLLGAGHNVIVKLHDRSLGVDAERTGGIDWLARLARFDAHPRFALARGGDISPYLAAADLLVTDHSTVGFEFALLDRPIVVFDAPQLREVARISADKWELLRSMADIVRTPPELGPTVAEALADPLRMRDARQEARALFAHPGRATAHALGVVYELLEVTPPSHVEAAAERPGFAAAALPPAGHEPPLHAEG